MNARRKGEVGVSVRRWLCWATSLGLETARPTGDRHEAVHALKTIFVAAEGSGAARAMAWVVSERACQRAIDQ
eukprot:SAG31_NODE_211_length_20274_cov_40.333482_11_plen_73_part_00